MRAVFVDADEALAAVTEKLRSPGDPSLSIHRDIKVKSAQAARCVGRSESAAAGNALIASIIDV